MISLARLLTAVLGLLPATCVCLAADGPASSPAVQPPEIVVATYNVLYKNPDIPRLGATIREFGADVVFLQETTAVMEKPLVSELQTTYPHHHFHPGPGSGGFAQFSRWPMEEVRYVAMEAPSRGFVVGRIRLPGGGTFAFGNLHLKTPELKRMTGLASTLAVFQEVGEIQEKELARVLKELPEAPARLLVGDFNSFSFGPVQTALKAEGWTDSGLAASAEADQTPTWRRGARIGAAQFRIDFIFHSPAFSTVKSRVEKVGDSDHYPVISVLRPPAR